VVGRDERRVSVEPDTIAAVATAPGVGAIALVRVSGPGAEAVLAALAPELGALGPREARVAAIRDPRTRELIDQAVVIRYPGPASYTGEDVVEISGHGGWLGPALVLDACVTAGARLAEAGEFTRRAYLNGRMDLVQAEAVTDLIGGRSRALRRAALGQLDRGLSERVDALRGDLLGLEAVLVHHLDFPEEDDPPFPVAAIAERSEGVARRLQQLLDTAAEGELLREGALAVLAGLPNSGKSSLFNALLGQDRAIVTPVPGTTRDALEATVSLDGFPFRLVDTAGLRETDDPVERIGVEVARRYLGAADLVLLCVEGARPLDERERAFLDDAGTAVVVVRTKADLDPAAAAGAVEAPPGACGAARVSALRGDGLSELRGLLPRLAYRGLVAAQADAPVLTRARQARAVESALEELRSFARALRAGIGPEVAAAHLRPAESALEEVLGTITPDDVLDRVFAEFCVGK
jgi:tRNA modification GTPase